MEKVAFLVLPEGGKGSFSGPPGGCQKIDFSNLRLFGTERANAYLVVLTHFGLKIEKNRGFDPF